MRGDDAGCTGVEKTPTEKGTVEQQRVDVGEGSVDARMRHEDRRPSTATARFERRLRCIVGWRAAPMQRAFMRTMSVQYSASTCVTRITGV